MRGDYVFKPEDKIIIIAKDGSSAEIQKFFTSPKKGFWGIGNARDKHVDTREK